MREIDTRVRASPRVSSKLHDSSERPRDTTMSDCRGQRAGAPVRLLANCEKLSAPSNQQSDESAPGSRQEAASGARAHTRSQDARNVPTESQAPRRQPTARARSRRQAPMSLIANALCLTLLILSTGAAQCKAQSSTTGDSETSSSSQTQAPSSTPELGIDPTEAPPNATAHVSKLKPVNFTLVDELFESVLSEADVLARWKNMDAQFQEGIRSILKLVFPQIVAVSQDAKVSGDCSGGILKWILSLRNLRSWAIKSKPTAGIFKGSLTMFGNHEQCLSIRAPDEDEIEITEQFEEYFRGQFCMLHLRPWLPAKKPFYHLNSSVEPLLRKNYKYYEKTLYDELAEIAVAFNFIDIRMDLCVPSTCTMADIQRVADLLGKKLELKAKVMRCDMESREPGSTFVQSLDSATTYWLVAPLGLLAINLISTILVALGVFTPSHNNSNNNKHEQSIPSSQQSGDASIRFNLHNLFYSLSIQGALRNLLTCPRTTNVILLVHDSNDDNNNNNNNNNNISRSSSSDDNDSTSRVASRTRVVTSTNQLDKEEVFRKPLPLYGLRNVFIVWFVIVQLTVELKYQYLRDSLVLRNMMLAYWPFQIIINTSMIFESLILITAFTYSYCNLETTARGLLGYIGDKYIRLVPSIVTIIFVTIALPSIGITSPVWKNFVEQQSGVCKSTGYLGLLFLQNFISYDKICLPHTWLFCVELQLMALTIPLVLVLKGTLPTGEDFISKKQQSDKGKRRDSSQAIIQDTLRRVIISRAGLFGLCLVAMGTIVNFFLVYSYQLPPSWFHTFPDAEQKSYYFGKYLTKTWTHLSAFVIGLYAGHMSKLIIQSIFMHGTSRSDISSSDNHSNQANGPLVEQRRAIVDFSWRLVAFGCLLSIIFCTFTWSTQELPSPLVSALYDSLSRLVWSLALAGLTVHLCMPKNINHEAKFSGLSSLFSHPVCLILGRLSFLAYLVSPLVHTFVLAVQEQSLFPSLYLIFHVVLGNIVITYLIAFLLALMIERPIRLAVRQLCCMNTRTRGSATISTTNVTTATRATSLANE